MLKKLFAILIVVVMTFALIACGAGEETTLTGIVVSVEGTVISLMEMDTANMGNGNFAEGERPEKPEGMEDFQGFGDFKPEAFDGTLPEGETFPKRSDGERPQMPEGMEPPEGMTMPEDGQMPDFSGENGGKGPGFGNFNAEDAETKSVDIANAHISVEIDGGKATGSMTDIKTGTFVTVTVNGKGEATNVLVSSQSFFGGGRGAQN